MIYLESTVGSRGIVSVPSALEIQASLAEFSLCYCIEVKPQVCALDFRVIFGNIRYSITKEPQAFRIPA